ncbi:receptor-transporting protein 3-like [Discoglossus pictus]
MAGRRNAQSWAAVFQKLQETEFTQPYNNSWTLEIDNNLKDDLTSCQRQQGWKVYQSSSFGSFTCSDCRHFWNSARVSLTFHYRRRIAYMDGEVRLRLYRQKCRNCQNLDMLTAGFEEDKITDVLMRLITRIKKNCYNEKIEIQPRIHGLKMTKPHEASLCEACMMGKCNRDADYS